MSRLGLRARLQLLVAIGLAAALAALIAAFNVILDSQLNRTSRDLVRSRAVAQVDSLHVRDGRLTIGEAPDDKSTDAYVWIFASGRTLEQPRAASSISAAARAIAAGPARFVDVRRSDTRLYAAPVQVGGKRLGTVVAGISLAPYEQTRRAAFLASLILGAVILVVVLLVARWLLRSSLRPVVRMTRQAAEWSDHNLEHRFGLLGPPKDELRELGATLNGLLDRLASSLRRERRFSAELSHELRTPLARVLAESELALRRDRSQKEYQVALASIHRNAEQLSRTVDALVAAARYEAGGERGTADAHSVVESAARACAGLAGERAIKLEIAQSSRALRIGVDADLAERIVQPILENACRYGSGQVQVAIGRANSSVVYTVEDDGPGVASDEKERIFEPGVRGSARRDGIEGAGLGLALARRLARSVDGEVIADAAASGGRFLVTLPVA